MNPVIWFFLFLLGVFAFVGSVMAIGMNFDRVIVCMLRTFRIFAFPNAIRLAVSLERDTAEWEVRQP